MMLSIGNLKSLAFILIIGIVIFSFIVFSISTTQPEETPLPIATISPTSYPNLAPPSISPAEPLNNEFNSYSEEYLKEQEKINQQEQPVINQALTVSAFIDKLPVNGQLINVTYNIYNNQVTLEYDLDNKQEALQEFANLLKENKIGNINWIPNLAIIEK